MRAFDWLGFLNAQRLTPAECGHCRDKNSDVLRQGRRYATVFIINIIFDI